ncbi:MAG TPA: 23S rRNA (guanosine(2251)-2'-O)-methyltransferase RlmB [Caulobacterales bacterium]|nr:23S rRNA (guanosine(2251)-2'-O)-methyltransferase RlmB [Caulobacterales bacterium]
MRSPPPLKHRPAHRRERASGGDANWIWGTHAALAALANPERDIERIVATRSGAERLPQGLKVKVDLIEPDALDRLLPPGAVHQGLAVRASPLEAAAIEDACAPVDGRPVLVLDSITDPQNVGALFRSAAAFNVRAIVMQDRKAPPLTGALAKAAAGAIERVPEVRVVNIARAVEQLAEMGYRTIGLEGEGPETIECAAAGAAQIALVLGAEGRGLRDLVAERCDHRARIPIAPEMESLNVSVAGAVALYAISAKP